MAFYPNAVNPQWLYVAETNRVTRYAYRTGDLKAARRGGIVVPELPSGRPLLPRHRLLTRTVRRCTCRWAPQSNVAEDMSKKSPGEIKAWEAATWSRGRPGIGKTGRAAGLGAADGGPRVAGKVYASGIRNCVSLTVQPCHRRAVVHDQ